MSAQAEAKPQLRLWNMAKNIGVNRKGTTVDLILMYFSLKHTNTRTNGVTTKPYPIFTLVSVWLDIH